MVYGLELDSCDIEGIDPVMETVLEGNVEVFEFLLDFKVDLNRIYTG